MKPFIVPEWHSKVTQGHQQFHKKVKYVDLYSASSRKLALISTSQPDSQASANTARPRYGLVYHAICLFTPPAFAEYSFHPSLDRLDFPVRDLKSRLHLHSDKNNWNDLQGRSRSFTTAQFGFSEMLCKYMIGAIYRWLACAANELTSESNRCQQNIARHVYPVFFNNQTDIVVQQANVVNFRPVSCFARFLRPPYRT